MKLASYKQGRDGQLMVVSNDLTNAVPAGMTMQAALDDWASIAPRLQKLSDDLDAGKVKGERFDTSLCASPLPRAYQVLDGSAYLSHVRLTRKSRGAEMPPEFEHDPLMYQAVSDTILGPCDPIFAASEDLGIDYEAEVAVIVDDVPMGVTPEEAADHIIMVLLMNDITLRTLAKAELAKGFGFINTKPPSAFSPVAVTPDALGSLWKNGKLHVPVMASLNGKNIGSVPAGEEMQFDFPTLIAHGAKTRPLSAGTIVGSGTISTTGAKHGISCLVERRMLEMIEAGDAKTPFLKFGDTIRIEAMDKEGRNIFGSIEQKVAPYIKQAKAQPKKVARS